MNTTACLQTVLKHIDAGMDDAQAIFKTAMDLPLNNWPADALVSQLKMALSDHRGKKEGLTWDPLKVEPFNLLSKPRVILHTNLLR
ncbi:MAG: hypothetical protein EXS51_01610 [Candidatus Taylorbacteria bacterium]|nr:hypothetical protein [Candidatus Taylorbacteria bacterium]